MERLYAVVIFLVTLFLVITKPKKLGIGYSAWVGAIACLLLELVDIHDVIYITSLVWDATLTFIFLVFISIVLDKAGFFEWASIQAIKYAKGNGFLLFLYFMTLGAFISAIFANDGTALMLTPIIHSKIKHLRLPQKSVLPYIMGSGFIADTSSLPLVISNLTNIITAHFFQISFWQFALYMFFPNIVAVITSILVLYIFYRKDLIKRYDPDVLEGVNPRYAVRDPLVFKVGWIIITLLGFSFLILSMFQIKVPFSLILGISALFLSVSTLKNRVISIKSIYNATPWSIVFFSIGMYTVIYSFKKVGIISFITWAIHYLLSLGAFYTILGTGFISAFLSAFMNNLPTVMIMNMGIESAGLSQKITNFLALANVVGTNIGPKLTPIGSLATLLWLHILEHKGVKITYSYYIKVGFLLTLPVLLSTLVALYLVFVI
jgi:arsenical pump membrane protein